MLKSRHATSETYAATYATTVYATVVQLHAIKINQVGSFEQLTYQFSITDM